MGRAGEKPAIPLNHVGDFGGRGLMLAYGMVCALLETKSSGKGQVVDAAMIDGASTLMASSYAANPIGFWSDERDAFFDGADICYAPVLSMAEVRHHPHHQARDTYIDDGEVWQPAPAPRFSRTPGAIQRPPAAIGEHSEEILRDFGFSDTEISRALASGAIKQA